MANKWMFLLITILCGGCAAEVEGATSENSETPVVQEEVGKTSEAVTRSASCYADFFQTCRTNAIQAGTDNRLNVSQGPFCIVDVYDTSTGVRVYHHESGWLSHNGSVGGLYGWYYARCKSTDGITLTKVEISSVR